MAKKTGFIKVKHKGFKKLFSKKELLILWNIFEDNFNYISNLDKEKGDIDWKKHHYLDFIENKSLSPVYPETDIADNSEGFTPKQLRKMVDFLGFENLKIFFLFLSKNSNRYNNGDVYSDGFISWKKVFSYNFEERISNKDYSFFGQKIFYFSINDTEPINRYLTSFRHSTKFKYSLDMSLFEEIAKDNSVLNKILSIDNYPNGFVLTLESLNFKQYISKMSNLWKKEEGFIPKNIKVLLMDPSLWDKNAFLDSMFSLYNTKQFSDLSEEEQNSFIKIYIIFNKHLPFFIDITDSDLFLKKNGYEFYLDIKPNLSMKLLERIKNLSKRGITIDISFNEYYNITAVIDKYKDAEEYFLNKDTISREDIFSLNRMGNIILHSVNKDFLNELSFDIFLLFESLNISEYKIKEYIDLFNETKNIELKSIPLVKGSFDEYTYEVLPKNDIRGLLCGLATNCCQHLDNVGVSCTLYGAYKKTSSFFIVSKNGKIVAQSWIWLSEDKKTLVCDSIETLNRSEKIFSCYKEMAKSVLSKSKITKIVVGSSPFNNELELDPFPVEVPVVPDNIYDMLEDNENADIEDGMYSDAYDQFILMER